VAYKKIIGSIIHKRIMNKETDRGGSKQGEVQNNGSETAKFVEVSATLYDSNNKVIGTEFAFTKPSEIEPGQKAPFEITVGTDKVMGGDLSIIDHYAVQASS
jgi:hypothetical protein